MLQDTNIRVAHVITGLDVGGTERSLLSMLPRLEERGITNCVYCVVGHGAIGEALVKKGIPVIYLDFKNVFDVFRISYIFWLELRKNKPDLVVTYLIHADLFGRIVGCLAGVEKIISFKRGSLLQWGFLNYLERATGWLVTRYITVSVELKSFLIENNHVTPEKIDVVRNGIEMKLYDVSQEARIQSRREFSIDSGVTVFGVIAKLRKGKGHGELIEAFSGLLNELRNKKIKLLIVGDGEEKEKIEKQVHDAKIDAEVVITGRRDDVPALLAAIDIFVLPTEYEGMSVALLEAMAAKKPIITTSIEANMEMLDSASAIFVEPRNVADLKSAMERLLKDSDYGDRVALNAYKYCLENYSLEKSVERFAKIIKTV